MTLTHLSHFDLTEIGRTDDNVILEGSLAACKRIAAAHGLEVVRYEGMITGSDGNRATYAPVDMARPSLIYLTRGMIVRGRDGYSIVIPMDVWNND